MSDQLIVRLNARATVNTNDWEAFKKMVAETKEIVKKEGPQTVLTHECYFDPATFNCLIIEAYASEAAFLAHLELIRPLSEKYKVDWEINRLELLGPYSVDVIDVIRRASKENAFFHYPASL